MLQLHNSQPTASREVSPTLNARAIPKHCGSIIQDRASLLAIYNSAYEKRMQEIAQGTRTKVYRGSNDYIDKGVLQTKGAAVQTDPTDVPSAECQQSHTVGNISDEKQPVLHPQDEMLNIKQNDVKIQQHRAQIQTYKNHYLERYGSINKGNGGQALRHIIEQQVKAKVDQLKHLKERKRRGNPDGCSSAMVTCSSDKGKHIVQKANYYKFKQQVAQEDYNKYLADMADLQKRYSRLKQLRAQARRKNTIKQIQSLDMVLMGGREQGQTWPDKETKINFNMEGSEAGELCIANFMK